MRNPFRRNNPAASNANPRPMQHEASNPFEVLQRGARQAASSLIDSLGATHQMVEEQFEAATQAAMHASMQAPASSQGPPAASAQVLHHLPQIRITRQDLVEPTNRECCVCFDLHRLNDKVLRLPCAHVFHPQCITKWLQSHCTCPVCRYELPTDDPDYERGRIERMRNRKPRFARHELDRMTVSELKALLAKSKNCRQRPVDKHDLISLLISSNAIDVVETPEPVTYRLSALKDMSVGALRRCMNDEAGVFYDPNEVVEKADMIQIFLNSGRLLLNPEDNATSEINEDDFVWKDLSPINSDEDEEDKYPSSAVASILVETVVDETDVSIYDRRVNKMLLMEENSSFDESSCTPAMEDVERFLEFKDETSGSATADEQFTGIDAVEVALTDAPMDMGADSQNVKRRKRVRSLGGNEYTRQVAKEKNSAKASLDSIDEGNVTEGSTALRLPVDDNEESMDFHGEENISSCFDDLSVSELRARGREISVDLSDCIERAEIVQRLSSIESDGQRAGRLMNWEKWRVSDLRAVAALTGVDLSECLNRQSMVEKMQHSGVERPHLGRFLHSLAPLARLTSLQLLAVARDWQVDVSDCLEKGDILRRLVESGPGIRFE